MVVGVLILGACGGGELTPEAYFDSLNAETENYAEAVTSLRDDYGDELGAELETLHASTDFSDTVAVDAFFSQSKEVAIVKTAELFSDNAAALRLFLDEIEAMEPPESLTQAHGDAVASGEALLAAMPLTIEAIRNLDAMDALEETIAASPYFVASQRFGIACTNLESEAASQGIEIDLSCPEGVASEDEGG